MSDKNFTPASGISYELRRQPDGSYEARAEGKTTSARPDLKSHRIDHQTLRVLGARGESRSIFWVYAKGNRRVLSWPGGSMELETSDLTEGSGAAAGALKPLKLTMPGKVLSVKVKEGETVELNQGLLIVEAMKMENLLLSPVRAKIARIHVKDGDRLESGAVLITFSPAE